MRVVHFEPASKRYEIAYQSLLYSPLPIAKHERKTHGSALSKLESIGQVRPIINGATGEGREPGPDDVRLYVSVTGGDLALEEAEWDLLARHVEATVQSPTFAKALLREADAFLDALAASPPVEARV